MGQRQTSVLIVEDHRDTAELYALKLRLDGYAVHLAADATTAQVIYERARPDVVCVDTRLPDRGGREAAAAFAGAGAVVILLTNDQESYESPPAGVARALLKSRTTPRELSATIAGLVEQRSGTSQR
ncbi:MAG: response regulator [Candidatus Dormibacterales bacterium]